MERKQKKIDKNKHYKVNDNTYGIKLDKRHILLISATRVKKRLALS